MNENKPLPAAAASGSETRAAGEPKLEWRVVYEDDMPGLGWRDKADPSWGGFAEESSAVDLMNELSKSTKYRNIRIEFRPVPEPWSERK